MFGYVRPNKPEMLVREFEQYKAAYCELCNQLGKQYGVLTRLSLSYDCTIYAILGLAVSGESVQMQQKTCKANPLKKCAYLASEGDAYKKAAALTVLMTYHKLRDNKEDEGFFRSLAAGIGELFFRGKYKKAKRDYPRLAEAAEKMIEMQKNAEQAEEISVDECSEPTAHMLAVACEELSECPMQRVALREFGYFLGRWIYLMDAADDLAEDLRKRRFNPLIQRFELEESIGKKEGMKDDDKKRVELACNEMLNASISMMIPALNLINMEIFSSIVYNVVEKGLPEVQREILFLHVGKKKERKDDRSV